jgi:hypothetical protein
VVAAGVAVYAAWDEANGLAGLAGLAAIVLVLVAVTAPWDDGLVAGAGLLLAAYTLSVADDGGGVDRTAPLAAVGLLAVVELGSWSLEVRDGGEERPVARVPRVMLLLGAAAAASGLLLAVSSLDVDAGLAFWMVGALAAFALIALMTSSRKAADG